MQLGRLVTDPCLSECFLGWEQHLHHGVTRVWRRTPLIPQLPHSWGQPGSTGTRQGRAGVSLAAMAGRLPPSCPPCFPS